MFPQENPKLLLFTMAFTLVLAHTKCCDGAGQADEPKATGVLIEIPQSNKVKWSGFEEASGGVFVPVKGKFEVIGGKLVSTLGRITKEAQFTSWSYVYSDASKNQVVGWGPCLTAGEVIVSKIQNQKSPDNRFVDNSFIAEDFGDSHTLIKLDPKKKHRLCILYQPEQAVAFSGGFAKFASTEISGIVSDGPTKDKFFVSTAGYPGTKAFVNGQLLERRAHSWEKVQP